MNLTWGGGKTNTPGRGLLIMVAGLHGYSRDAVI